MKPCCRRRQASWCAPASCSGAGRRSSMLDASAAGAAGAAARAARAAACAAACAAAAAACACAAGAAAARRCWPFPPAASSPAASHIIDILWGSGPVPACSAPHSGREVQRRLGPPCVAATVVNESSLADPRAPGCCAGRRCPRISTSPRRRLPAWTVRVRPSRPLVADGLLR